VLVVVVAVKRYSIIHRQYVTRVTRSKVDPVLDTPSRLNISAV